MPRLTEEEWKQRFTAAFVKLTECSEDDASALLEENWPECMDEYEDEPEEAAEIYSVDYE